MINISYVFPLFEELTFQIGLFVSEVDSWLNDYFGLQFTQDHYAFIVAFFVTLLYVSFSIFMLWFVYKFIRFLFNLFV